MPKDTVKRPLGCTCFSLRKLARRTTNIYDEYLAPSGLTLTQYSLLSHLTRVSSDPDMRDLAELIGMDRTTLTRLLKPLEEAGLLGIRLCSDRRRRRIVLTDKGRSAWEKARPLWQRAQDDIAHRLGSTVLFDLHKLVDRAYTALS
jgi:DNA-binding MarR family transcriptional regulator